MSCQTADKLTPEGICTLVQEKKYVTGIEDCSTYYQCIGGKPVKKACPQGHVFDKEKELCVASNNCDPSVEYKCSRKVDGFVSDFKSCSAYHWCVGGVSKGRGVCPEYQRFDESVGEGSCVWEDVDQKCEREESICDYIKSGEYFGSPDDCSVWRQCAKNGPISTGSCGETLKFSLEDGSCAYETACRQLNGIADAPLVRPPPPATTTCAAGSDTHIKDGSTCGGFYYCEKGKTLGKWGLCADNKFFNGKKCVDRTETVCQEDRCQGMGNGVTWVNIAGDGCRGFHYCGNGTRMAINPGLCKVGWFDEKLQMCVPVEVKYPACVKVDPGVEPTP